MRISRSRLRRIIREELIRESCAAVEAGNEPCDEPFTISQSDIHGLGAFTGREFKQGQPIGISHVERPSGGWNVTDLGRYHNHSESPTCANVPGGGVRKLHVIRDLPPGVEITVDYREQPDLEQPGEDWHT